jgi:[ribosomal protein S5]-alanine N-acetyltransferase
MLFPLQNIPTITTNRLTLDGFSPEDHRAFSEMLADPRVGAPKGFPQGATPEQAWAGMANILGHWALRGFGLFAVRLSETREFVGSVGLIAPEGWPSPEATWTVAYPHQGKGYAKEAATAVRDHAMHELQLEKIVSFVPPGNEPSRRVAAAIGMNCSGTVRVFGELAEAWELRR